MLPILRQMSLEEIRYAAAACGAGADISPEGVVKALCRECCILGWGFVPLSREDALFEQVGQRLGVPDGPKGARGVPVMERRVFAALLRRAWEAADPSYQQRFLEAASSLWDVEGSPAPALPAGEEPGPLRVAMDAYLTRPAGLRALAAAAETVPLVFPPPPELPFSQQLGAMVGSFGGLRPRPDRGHPALFEVLKICWRARQRLLGERRAQRHHLEWQLRQLVASLEQRGEDLRAAASPWKRQWARGFAAAGGALVATCVQLALGVSNPVGWIVLTAGLTWSTAHWVMRPRAESDPGFARLQGELGAVRQQIQAVQQSITVLERS